MSYKTIPSYLSEIFEQVKYWILTYEASGGGGSRSMLCGLLGADAADDDWEKLRQSRERLSAAAFEGAAFPFEQVCKAFDLNPFERFALSFALACELDGRFLAAVKQLGAPFPTLGLALRIFSKSPEEACVWRIAWIDRERKIKLLFTEEANSEDVRLKLRSSVLRFLLGLDFGIDGVETHYPSEPVRSDLSGLELFKEINRQGTVSGGVIVLRGQKGAGRKHQLRLLSAQTGVPVLFAEKGVSTEKDTIAALLISGGYLCICDVEESDDIEAMLKLAAGYASCIFLTTDSVGLAVPADFVKTEFYLPPLSASRRRIVWDVMLGELENDTDASAVSAKYAFNIGQIESSLVSALLRMRRIGEKNLTPELLEAGCNDQLPRNVSALAKSVPPVFTWDELILPAPQKHALKDACDRVRLESQVYEDWGFGRKLPYGRGLRLLFTGPPGTGKTMAAQVMANEMKMELFKVDLSSLMSKYIGETEKNLASVFDGARRSGGILFFDEADALFGKRGEQKDSHDRYANMQTAYLLQAVEDYEGVLILATNLMQNFDPAFMRRIHTRVDFELPSREDRLEIWKSFLHGGAPLDDGINCGFLAESFELSGAEIKNIILTAAFLAAAREKSISMDELINALLTEYAKSGKIISKSELGEYAQ